MRRTCWTLSSSARSRACTWTRPTTPSMQSSTPAASPYPGSMRFCHHVVFCILHHTLFLRLCILHLPVAVDRCLNVRFQMIETGCFEELNVWGPDGGPSPDLLPENAPPANGARQSKPGLFSRLFGRRSRTRTSDYESHSMSRSDFDS